MTDELTIDGKPPTDDDPNKGIELDAHGDPVLQGTRMIEKESYERVIEGLRMVADASAHLIKHEPINALMWRGYMTRFDKARKICVQHAGLGLAMKEQETSEMRGDPLPWRQCRERFLEGCIQAAGGCRQLATCHRGDLWWSQMAETLDSIVRKLRTMRQIAARRAALSLILPDNLH